MATHEDLNLTFVGVAPLLMRCGRLADPLDEHTLALHKVCAKRVKTVADHQRIAQLEWRGSLWLSHGRPCVPAEAVEASIVNAGKIRRAGKLLRSALIVRETPLLLYDGASDLKELYEDKQFVHRAGVRVQTRTTMRTRPRFNKWSIRVTLSYLPTMIDGDTLLDIARVAGDLVGLGDYRPRFGRFLVKRSDDA